MKKVIYIIIVVLIVFLIIRFINNDNKKELVKDNIFHNFDGNSYIISSINDKELSGNEVNYKVEFENGNIHAKICNNINGQIISVGDKIKASNGLISTMMFCDALMEDEALFLDLFNKGEVNYNLTDKMLTLSNESSVIVLNKIENTNN